MATVRDGGVSTITTTATDTAIIRDADIEGTGPMPSVPFKSRSERVNDLRVALSSIKTLARDGYRTESHKLLMAIYKTAIHALERDKNRIAVTPKVRELYL